jgi:para-nitrobenzyl esterase
MFMYGTRAKAVGDQYPLSRFNGSAAAAFTQADADHVVTCPSYKIARAAANMSTRVHVYRFAHLQRQCDLALLLGVLPAGVEDWASHASELVFVFNNTFFENPLVAGKMLRCALTPEEHALSGTIMSFWSSIAHTGVPRDSTPKRTAWPSFLPTTHLEGQLLVEDANRETTLLLAAPSALPTIGVKQDDCEFWAAHADVSAHSRFSS